jgi:hypothetical protein
MTIPLTGAGSLFVRLGHVFGRLADLQALRGSGVAGPQVGTGAGWPSLWSTVEADYANGTALRQVVEGAYSDLSSWQGQQQAIFNAFQTRAKNTLKAMYNVDQGMSALASLAQLTQNPTDSFVMAALIAQMKAASASVQGSTPALGAQTAVGSPAGNPQIVGSVKDARGNTLQYCYPETLSFVCSRDAQTGGATAGNETLTVQGQPTISGPFDPLWPGGSNVNGTLALVDGSKNNPTTGNVFQNSDFAVATTVNVPDNWTIQVGAAGVDVFTDAGNAYTPGGGALKFLGTGAALLDAVTQSFNTTPATGVGAGGTSYKLLPDTQYIANFWVKTTSVPTAGVLEMALIDGSAYPGAVVADEQGVNNLKTYNLTAGGLNIGNTYTPLNFTFRTPTTLTGTAPYRLRLRLSTAIDSGKAVWVGRLGGAVANPLYAGGPSFQAFSGSAPAIAGLAPDAWTMALTMTFGVIQSWFERVWGMRGMGLVLPFSGSPTVADSLVA